MNQAPVQRLPYQKPILEQVGVFVAIVGGSPIRVPIQTQGDKQ